MSETRESYESGAVRDSREGKGRYDLLSPLALRRLALTLEAGAKHYADRNWEQGMNLSRFMDSALRHLFQHLEGRRNEDHLAHALWNVMAMILTEEAVDRGLLPADLADLPDYRSRKDGDRADEPTA